jgi:uncharacterized membrane protein YqjE
MTPNQPGTPDDVPKTMPHKMSSLVTVLLRYLEARGVLLTIEAQEAFQQVLSSVVWCVVAVIFGFTGWLLVVASAVDLISREKGWPLAKTALAAGGVHVLLAVIVFAVVMRKLSTGRWFAHTMNEFEKDRIWLAQQSEKQ